MLYSKAETQGVRRGHRTRNMMHNHCLAAYFRSLRTRKLNRVFIPVQGKISSALSVAEPPRQSTKLAQIQPGIAPGKDLDFQMYLTPIQGINFNIAISHKNINI